MSLPIGHNPIVTPNPQQGLTPFLIDDIIPPRYPGGCELVFMRLGVLAPVVTVPIQEGSMIMMIPPEQAVHVRAMIANSQKLIRENQEKLARNGVG